MSDVIYFINEKEYFSIEFDNFNDVNNFKAKIFIPFLKPMKKGNLQEYGLELPFIMTQAKKEIVKKNLQEYLKLHPKFNRIVAFFNRIDNQGCFYIFFGDLSQEFCETCKESLKYYNQNYDHDFVHKKMMPYLEFNEFSENIIAKIREEYEINFYRFKKKTYLGEKDKKKRVCRFCGKSMEEGAKFVNEAHSIPAFMGNKTLFQNEECDECNSYFGEGIENDLDNYTKVMRTFAGIEGRNGIPEIYAKDKKIFYADIENEYKGPVIISSSNNKGNPEIINIKSEYPFIPSNVFKILCKIFFSVVDYETVKKYEDTIKWIRHNEAFLEKLPLVAFTMFPQKKLERAEIVTYINKSKDKVPFAFMEFRFGYFVYIVQIPSIGNKNELFYKQNEFEEFLKSFTHYKDAVFNYYDFTSKEATTFNYIFNLTKKCDIANKSIDKCSTIK